MSSVAHEHTTTPPRQAFFTKKPCEMVATHQPKPVITENHHTKPEYLQRRLYGVTLYPADKWLCSNCHEAVHAWLYWLLGERAKPPYIGNAAKAEAERTYSWYMSEKARLYPNE
jgi:hypothetical protein